MEAHQGWPGELRPIEIAVTRKWLARRGIEVGEPSRLLAIRVGPRLSGMAPGRLWWLVGAVVVSTLLGGTYEFLVARGEGASDGVSLYFICASLQTALWASYLHRERALGPLPVMDRRSGRPPARKILGGWYIASLTITFGGAAALAAAIHLTTPAKAYAWTWLGALCWPALCCAVILVVTLRRPVRAEDTASAAVDTELRVLDCQAAVPGLYGAIVLFDVATGDNTPAGFTGWLIAYAVLALGTTALGLRHHYHHRALPPGDYGTPVRRPLDLAQ